MFQAYAWPYALLGVKPAKGRGKEKRQAGEPVSQKPGLHQPKPVFLQLKKGVCQSGEGQGLEKPFHSTFVLSVSPEQPGTAQTFCNLRENSECLLKAVAVLLSRPLLHASCSSEGCRRGRLGSPLPPANLACGTRWHLWYKMVPMVQDGACGTKWRLWYKMAPIARPALLGLLLAVCGTHSTRWYPRLPSALADMSWGSFSDLQIGRGKLKAFVYTFGFGSIRPPS